VLEDQPVRIKCCKNILPVLTNEQKSGNMFDRMPALAPPKLKDGRNELDRYLRADVEHVTDALAWWYERRVAYPCLLRMALDYLSIPGRYICAMYFLFAHISLERLFSRGRLVLSHVRSGLSVHSTRALLCLGSWFQQKLVKAKDLKGVGDLPEMKEEQKLESGWDNICIL
jgi:hypothetical protein